MTENWYSEGLDSAAKTIATEAAEAARRRAQPRRFFVKAGTSATVMWVDDNGFSVWEHIPFIPNKMNQEFTCTAPMGQQCAGCEQNVWRRYQTFFTLLDLTLYQGRNGPVVNERRLLVAPPDFAMRVRNWKAQPLPANNDAMLKWVAGTLKGRKFSVFRAEGEKNSIGNGWDAVPEPPMSREMLVSMRDGLGNPVFPTHVTIYNYREILAPLPYEDQVKRLVGHVAKNTQRGTNATPAGAAAPPLTPGAFGVSTPAGAVSTGALPAGATPMDAVPF